MIGEFVSNHIFVCSILLVGGSSLFLQSCIEILLRSYVKATDHMETTQKKNMLHLKNQFEAIYGMQCQVRNAKAYVDKYLIKLRFLGIPYSSWDRLSYIAGGITSVLAMGGMFYNYQRNLERDTYVEILLTYGAVIACLFLAFHIFGVKSKKQQIQIQLVDYLENYMVNRLLKINGDIKTNQESEQTGDSTSNEDNKKELEPVCDQAAAAKEELKENPESDVELLEEFVQSFLA